MNKLLKLFVLLFIAATVINAQEEEKPRVSPKSWSGVTVGTTDVEVRYGAPRIKGREVWDKLVQYGKVWRTGANEASTLEVENAVMLNGKKLDAGKYSIFTIPYEDKWVIIFNGNAAQWGAFNYEEDKDALRIEVPSMELDHFHENMFIGFMNATENSADLVIAWGDKAAKFEVKEAN